jgi:5-methylcytosine-specific restriction endonuclease McrA
MRYAEQIMKKSRPEWVKWYKTSAWQKLRRRQLKLNPLCKFCDRKKILTIATVADHIQPHRGNMEKFFDIDNLQSLCKTCHDSTKQRLEKSGDFGCDEQGFPESWRN